MRLALIIYVKKYKDKNVNNLGNTEQDAAKLLAFLTEGLPKDFQFKAVYLGDPTANEVCVQLNRLKRKLRKAEKKAKKENRDERNLFLFAFVGHGFERPDGSQYLLCADAINVDKQTELVGGIGPATLNDFSEGLENTDVVNWIDACRGQVLRNRGREQYGLDKFRAVSDVDPTNSTKRELRIFSCARNQPASDDGLSTVAALDVMRKRLEAGKEIVLGEAFAESWGRRLNKKRLGNQQTPVSNGRPITLTPSVKKPESDRSQDQEKIKRLQKELEDTKRRYADLASKISAFESKPSPSAVWNGTSAGEYREIEIQGKTYGLCWIPPGKFTMGSPKSEKGRWDDET